jgi:hypothetical protein
MFGIDERCDQEAALVLMFLRSLDPDQLELYARTHPWARGHVKLVEGEREVRAVIWPSLVGHLGEEQAHAFWLNAVEIDDHQSTLRAGMSLDEVLEAALEVTKRQFGDESYE